MIEIAVATAVISLGVAALMVGVGSATRINAAGRHVTQAVLIAQELRERTVRLPFFDPELAEPGGSLGLETGEPSDTVDDVDDLNGRTFSPPRNAVGEVLSELPDWSESITVAWADPNDLTQTSATATDVLLVTVDITHQNVNVLSTSWLVTRRD